MQERHVNEICEKLRSDLLKLDSVALHDKVFHTIEELPRFIDYSQCAGCELSYYFCKCEE